MTRSGPRPYECVRRAWHSERHQPMRGLIIQQIFRLVHENHCGATKKNKEWLEQLPIVVLKAEEIMYSKANSEVEYSNLETLWDRVNEAVDTIIRKEESAETGEFLPPCVEAALNLGCVQVRASRSQRNSNPRPYLRPINQENIDFSPNVLNESPIDRHLSLMPQNTSKFSMFKKPQTLDSPRLVSECTGTKRGLKIGSVYPLYYDTNLNLKVPQLGFQNPPKSDAIILGVPVFSPIAEPSRLSGLQNLFPCAADKRVAQETSHDDSNGSYERGSQTGCDLSLRLGPFSCPDSTTKKGFDFGTGSVDRPKGKEFCFFPLGFAHGQSRLRTSRWNSEVENQSVELVSRKRKLPVNGDVDYEQCFWSRDPNYNHLGGQMKRPG